MDVELELLVGARGILQGKVPRTPMESYRATSRLCRLTLVRRALHCQKLCEEINLRCQDAHYKDVHNNANLRSRIPSQDGHDSKTLNTFIKPPPPPQMIKEEVKDDNMYQALSYNEIKDQFTCDEWKMAQSLILSPNNEYDGPLCGWVMDSDAGNFTLSAMRE